MRFYDEIGLLTPERISEENKYRYYSQKSIMQVALIKYFKMVGFNLEQIKVILNRTDNDIFENYLSDKLNVLNEELENIHKRIAAVKEWSILLEKGKYYYARRNKPVEVTLEDIPLYRVLKLNYRFDVVSDFTDIIYRISNEFTNNCGKQDFLTFGSFIAYYPDSRLRFDNILRDSAFYSELMVASAKIDNMEQIGDTKALKAIHIGEYSNIRDTYQIIFDWAEERNIKLQNGSFEKYIIDPWCSYSQDSYVTEIMVPLK